MNLLIFTFLLNPVSGGTVENYFSTPEQAHKIGTALLLKDDWSALASYYDLGGTDVTKKLLKTAEFYRNNPKLYVGPPGAMSKFKEPFSLAMKYAGAVSRGDLTQVTLEIKIPQGHASPVQIGLDYFYLRRSEKGFQFIPRTQGETLFSRRSVAPTTPN